MDNAPFTPEEEKFSDAHIASIRSQTTSPGTDWIEIVFLKNVIDYDNLIRNYEFMGRI